MPRDTFLAELYDPQHYRSSLVSQATLSRRCARTIVQHAAFPQQDRLDIVDYGGSDGALSAEVRRQLIERGHRGPIHTTVVDLFPRQDTEFQRFVTPDAFVACQDRYDIVIASAVLEHLPMLGEAVGALLSHACSGAIFYARTPYDAPLHQRIPGYRVKWPRHLHDLGPEFWDRFFETYARDGHVLTSRPSLVETTLRQAPLKTVAAHVLKFPGRIEARLRNEGRPRRWHLIGGWEVVLRLD